MNQYRSKLRSFSIFSILSFFMFPMLVLFFQNCSSSSSGNNLSPADLEIAYSASKQMNLSSYHQNVFRNGGEVLDVSPSGEAFIISTGAFEFGAKTNQMKIIEFSAGNLREYREVMPSELVNFNPRIAKYNHDGGLIYVVGNSTSTGASSLYVLDKKDLRILGTLENVNRIDRIGNTKNLLVLNGNMVAELTTDGSFQTFPLVGSMNEAVFGADDEKLYVLVQEYLNDLIKEYDWRSQVVRTILNYPNQLRFRYPGVGISTSIKAVSSDSKIFLQSNNLLVDAYFDKNKDPNTRYIYELDANTSQTNLVSKISRFEPFNASSEFIQNCPLGPIFGSNATNLNADGFSIFQKISETDSKLLFKNVRSHPLISKGCGLAIITIADEKGKMTDLKLVPMR